MEFTRDRVLDHTASGPTSHTTVVAYPAIASLNFTNASAADGSTVALPAAFNWESTFEYDCEGWDQIFVHVHTLALGGGGLTGIDVLIEYENPDVPDMWIATREPALSAAGGVEAPLRTATVAARTWSVLGVGNFIVASRKEHMHFNKFRVRFQATAGVADAATNILCYWHGNGGRGASFA
jgi:hypothetical protein